MYITTIPILLIGLRERCSFVNPCYCLPSSLAYIPFLLFKLFNPLPTIISLVSKRMKREDSAASCANARFINDILLYSSSLCVCLFIHPLLLFIYTDHIIHIHKSDPLSALESYRKRIQHKYIYIYNVGMYTCVCRRTLR